MTTQVGVLQSRWELLAAGLFCAYFAARRVLALIGFVTDLPEKPDAILIAGMAYVIGVFALVAIRSPSAADRVVCGSIASAFLLRLIRAFSPAELSAALNWLVALAWGSGALGAFLQMTRSSRAANR